MNILLVDDEAAALAELQDAIASNLPHASCHAFLRAGEALDYAAGHPVDIAFLDINMRVVNGITIAKKLQDLYPRVNIIFCTGYTEYALDALDLSCSGYLLKPITDIKVAKALSSLRYPVPEDKPMLTLHCFGNFEALADGKPIHFKYSKTKELLAYLTDRDGADCTTREIMAVLFEEDKKDSYFSNIRLDLLDTFAALGLHGVIRQARGTLGLEKDRVHCDFFDYLNGLNNDFRGEYMAQYSFAEMTCAALSKNSGIF